MIEKQPSVNPGKVWVTFCIPGDVWADQITLVGDFNGWNETSHPFTRSRSDPDWHITVELEAGRRYQFYYLRDGQEWNVDNHADDFEISPQGRLNFVVDTRNYGGAKEQQTAFSPNSQQKHGDLCFYGASS